MKEPEIIVGGSYEDERGVLRYNNDLSLELVKRFHIIEHSSTEVFRGWQGHRVEQKWFQVIHGSFVINVVKPDDWSKPSSDLKIESYTLTETNDQLLHLPGGYATGIRALESGSKLVVFSDLTVEESKDDDYRFNQDFWSMEALKEE